MYRTILVPLDGSGVGEHALGLALGIAQRAGARLHIAHVHFPATSLYTGSKLGGNMTLDTALRANESKYLDDVIRRLTAVASVPVTAAVLEGPTADGLLRHVQAISAGLIVMTTHGRGLVSKLWLGSVADQLVRQSPVPLLLVRPGHGAANLPPQTPPRHVLIPLDGTPFAEEIMVPALVLGSLGDADYTLLRVLKPALIPSADMTGLSADEHAQSLFRQVQALKEELQMEARNYLKKSAAEMEARGLRVQVRLLVHEQPAVAILDYARDHAVDLIAMQTHGRRGFAQMFVGSVADKVLRSATMPLLVQRPHEAQTAAPPRSEVVDVSRSPL